MKWTGLNDLRESFLSFFESKGHLRHESFPLVPIDDKSILLINAGMTPLKKYFTGEVEPPRHRMTTCQKCIRTPDIDRVGLTARHGTYFEMLGNFSFGDYFKGEAIPWAWEYITKVLEMPKDKLWATIYLDDDEAYDIWTEKTDIDPSHIVRLGKEDNFWEHGSGPCGPCSEIYFDRGEKFGCGKPDCKPGCDCDRFMEFWNLVFTQFDNDGNGNYTRLPKPNIDTGMGLERLACLMQGVNNLFEVDTVRKILDKVCSISGKEYGAGDKDDISIRVITDHIRSATFMICDGVLPSNEGRGYVLRRIIRRALRHGKLLGIDKAFLCDVCRVVIGENISAYPELGAKKDYILKVISMEEDRFEATMDAGLNMVSNIAQKALREGVDTISGDEVFRLYDTFGFPIDLTREIVSEKHLKIDEKTFFANLNAQRERARAARANISGWSEASKTLLSGLPKTEFVGYAEDKSEAKVVGIIVDDMLVESVNEGDFSLILNKTPFYGEGGGQVGDIGFIRADKMLCNVDDTKKTDGVYIHMCSLVNGEIRVGEMVSAEINSARRDNIRRNHSAAHLLQAALRTVLGAHVEQAGSYVDERRVRFDFTHFAAMTDDEIKKTESLVNAHILSGAAVVTTETDIETAKKNGAMALFGEKYGKVVRMVKMGGFSCELCGGTHIDNTAKIGLFKIISETSVAAGVRRIEGTTGRGVLEFIEEQGQLLSDTARELKAQNVHELAKRASILESDLSAMKREIETLNAKLAATKLDGMAEKAVAVGSVRLATAVFTDMQADVARTLCDEAKAKYSDLVTVVAVLDGGKLNFIASAGKDAVAAGAHSGKLVSQISALTGGKGGGRPDSAMSGGRDIDKLDAAIKAAPEILGGMLKK